MAGHHANVAVFVPHAGCPHRCAFCDQHTISGTLEPPGPDAVRRTLAAGLNSLGGRAGDAEIAFFGGSFTAIPRDKREALLEAARPFLGPGGYGGIRVSTRPDCVDDAVLGALRAAGVTAVELGAQSMDPAVLRQSRRGHTPEDVAAASRLIRGHGLALGLQMMTGLPGASPASDLATARALADLGPDTVRIYPTLVMAGTDLERRLRDGAYRPQTLEEAVDLCAGLAAFFAERDIPVIRMGLHDDASLRAHCVAGPRHPAFRELCEGRLMLDRLRARLRERDVPPGPLAVRVHPSDASRMAGQNRANTRALEAMGFRVKIVSDPAVRRLDPAID